MVSDAPDGGRPGTCSLMATTPSPGGKEEGTGENFPVRILVTVKNIKNKAVRFLLFETLNIDTKTGSHKSLWSGSREDG